MAIIARDQITLVSQNDISTTRPYYILVSNTSADPAKPTTFPPSGWSTTEPAYDSSKKAYICWYTEYSNGTYEYSDVSASSSYEAAKAAWNKANNAEGLASEVQPELIIGTHGSTATANWTGTSTKLSSITTGTRIQYKLSSAGVTSGVKLNLTLKSGTTTGAKDIYYSNTTKLSTEYPVNSVIDLIYDGTVWRILNPYTDTNTDTIGVKAGIITAGTNGIKNLSLCMMDSTGRWSSFTTTGGTGTKSRYTGGFVVGSDDASVLYNATDAAYTVGNATADNIYSALAIDLRYSTNCGTTLTVGKPVYLVGSLSTDNGLFTLDATWWTQTEPQASDSKTYIYLGIAYSTSQIYLSDDNPLYQYIETDELTGFYPVKKIYKRTTDAQFRDLGDRLLGTVSSQTFELLQADVRDIFETAGDAHTQAEKANKDLSDYKRVVAENYSTTEQTAVQISSSVGTMKETLQGEVESAKSELQQQVNSIKGTLTENEEVLQYFSLESDGFYIGDGTSSVRLRETSDKIQFVEIGSGKILLEINTDGLIGSQVTTNDQVMYRAESEDEWVGVWATRKGALVNERNNLNDVWIGG